MASHHPIPDSLATPNSDQSEAEWLNVKEGDLSMLEADWYSVFSRRNYDMEHDNHVLTNVHDMFMKRQDEFYLCF